MSSGNSTGERDPFAPPPAEAPDRPWQPRTPQPPAGGPEGQGTESPQGRPTGGSGAPKGGGPVRPPVPPHPWGPMGQERQGGPLGPYPPNGPQQRFDPSDPVQRRARYALLSGMRGLFFFIFSIPYISLLLGVLALYWGIGALRATSRDPVAATAGSQSAGPAAGQAGVGRPAAAPPASAPPAGRQPAPTLAQPGWAAPRPSRPPRPQVPAALGGLVTGGVALALVVGSWGIHLANKNYYDCLSDALTQKAEQSCSVLKPNYLPQVSDGS